MVAQFQVLARSPKENRMIAGEIAQAQSVHADLLARPRANDPLSSMDDDLVQVSLESSGRPLSQLQS